MRALLDTCIIIDALQNREPFALDARKIFILAANNQFTGCITAKSSSDIYYLTHRHTHNDKTSRSVLNKLFTLFDVLDTFGMDCLRAIPSPVSDFKDAIMIETAVRTEMDCIITRNTHDYRESPVTIYTPDQFLRYIETPTEL